MTRSLFQVPAPRIPSSSSSRRPRSWARADCARRPRGPSESAARRTRPVHIAPTSPQRACPNRGPAYLCRCLVTWPEAGAPAANRSQRTRGADLDTGGRGLAGAGRAKWILCKLKIGEFERGEGKRPSGGTRVRAQLAGRYPIPIPCPLTHLLEGKGVPSGRQRQEARSRLRHVLYPPALKSSRFPSGSWNPPPLPGADAADFPPAHSPNCSTFSSLKSEEKYTAVFFPFSILF